VFEGDTLPEYCPLVDCGDGYLVEIDDQIVDVVRGLWACGVSTKYCCSGHLYESCFSPYLMFDGFYSDIDGMDLAGFRKLLIAVNGEDGRVLVEEIEERADGEIFIVKSVCELSEKDSKKKLKCQVDFVEFFYDVLARMDVLWEEIVKQRDVSVMATDVAEA